MECVALRHLSFDFTRDLAPVASYEIGGAVMEVSTSFPVKSVPEFITYAKANPGKLNLASGGPGSAPGLYGELFKALAGVDLITVNYRGSAPALPDLIAGRVQVMFDPVIRAIGPIKAGKLRGLGVTTAQPIEALPDLPPTNLSLALKALVFKEFVRRKIRRRQLCHSSIKKLMLYSLIPP